MRRINQTVNNSFVYSPTREPIAEVALGEQVKIITLDTFSNRVKYNCEDSVHKLDGALNPLIGPIYINSAEPGDVLTIEIIDISPTRDWAVSILDPSIGGLTSEDLSIPSVKKAWFYKLIDNHLVHNSKLNFPWEPSIGTMATAPATKEISSLKAFKNGGNLDVPYTQSGNIVYLPISVPGAYFYIGDCHANQGEGEVSGFALEISAEITVKFNLIKSKKINGPRIESETELITIGSSDSMEESARIAYSNLIDWMTELKWDELEAYQALTQIGMLRVGNMVNPTNSLYAKINKLYI